MVAADCGAGEFVQDHVRVANPIVQGAAGGTEDRNRIDDGTQTSCHVVNDRDDQETRRGRHTDQGSEPEMEVPEHIADDQDAAGRWQSVSVDNSQLMRYRPGVRYRFRSHQRASNGIRNAPATVSNPNSHSSMPTET